MPAKGKMQIKALTKNKKNISLGETNMIKLPTFLIMLLVSMSAQSQTITQQLISSSGDEFKNNSYQLDWSIGEIVTETATANTQSLTQGFHQGNYTITAINQITGLQFEINAFPNPTSDFVQLKIITEKLDDLHYSLTKLNGQVLLTGKQTSSIHQINLGNYLEGTYLLSVYKQNQLLKTFKIIKSN